jgi:hypothetical protein
MRQWLIFVLTLSACAQPYVAEKRYALTKAYTADVIVDQRAVADVRFDAPGPLHYSETIALAVGPNGVNGPVRTETDPAIFSLILRNPSDNIVTIDWDHSAIVDSDQRSYKVRLLGEPKLPTGVRAIDKPPAPVLAPRSFITVLVVPDLPNYSDTFFLVPPASGAHATIRFVLALVGAQSPQCEATLHVSLNDAKVTRSTDWAWPCCGQRCLPVLGCGDGSECVNGVCQGGIDTFSDRKGLGAFCTRSTDCTPGMKCTDGRCSEYRHN